MSVTAVVCAGGCHIVVPPLYKTDVEPAGSGTFVIRSVPRSPGEGGVTAGAVTLPIMTAVYHSVRSTSGSEIIEFGLFSAVEDENRPAKDTRHYLNFEVVLRPGSAVPISVNVHSLAFLILPSRETSAIHRFVRQVGESTLAANSAGEITGRFTFELAQVTSLPAGDGAPVLLEAQFTAVPDLDLLRRMKLGNGRAIRILEDSHLRRTVRPPEDLDSVPLPESRPPDRNP